MGAPAHVVHSACGLGIDEATRPELVAFGEKLLRGDNVRQPTRGAATKRDGFAAMPNARLDATSPTAGYKLFADRTSAVRVTDTLHAEAFSSKAAAWVDMGRLPEAMARLVDLPSMGLTTYLEDVDATNGYVAASWLSLAAGSAYSAFVAVVDQVTGSVVRAPEKIGTSTDLAPPLLAVQGNYFVVVRYNSTGTKIEAWYLDTTSAATITTGWVAFGASLCADAAGLYVVHALPHASTPRIALFYSNTSGGTDRATVKTFDITGVAQTQTIDTTSTTVDAVAMGGIATDTLWLTWNQGLTVRVRGVSPFLITSDLAAVDSFIGLVTGCLGLGIAASTTAGKARLWATDTATVTQSQMMGVQTLLGVAASDGTAVVVPGLQMVRKPTFIGDRYYSAFLNLDTTSQDNFVVCDWTDNVNYLRPIANPAPGLASVGLTGQGKFVAGTTATTYYVGFGIKRSAVANGTTLLELDFANSKRWQTASHGNSTFLAAAIPSYSDGVRVAEVGFIQRPTTPTTTTSGTGITAVTGWRYVAVFEETDADGNWHVSGLSTPSASTGAVSNKTVTVTTQPLAMSSRLAPSGSVSRGVRIAWYRTLDGGEAPYFRIGTTNNDPTATTATFADTRSDAFAAAQSVLYSQPGVLGTSQDRRPPPSFSCIASYNGMLCGASGTDVWFSGQDVRGEGTWFNPIFQVPVPGDGDITALAVMDGALYVFKRREVYQIAGDPPSDNGAGGLGVPRRLACDVGCIDSRTPCTTALGIFFQSERGIEILTRSQTVEWIGEPYDSTVSAHPVCTSITVEPVSNTVLVELCTSESAGLVTGNGRTIVYDLSLKQWVSRDTRMEGTASQSACMLYTGTAWRYGWLAASGVVYAETPGTSLDAGAWITSTIETASAKHGLQQEQRVWSAVLLFERRSAAGLKIEIAYNYGAYSAADDKVWTEAATLGQTQLDCRPKSKSPAVRFRISDTAPAVLGTGHGFTFIGLSLDMGQKQGATTGTPRLDTTLRR